MKLHFALSGAFGALTLAQAISSPPPVPSTTDPTEDLLSLIKFEDAFVAFFQTAFRAWRQEKAQELAGLLDPSSSAGISSTPISSLAASSTTFSTSTLSSTGSGTINVLPSVTSPGPDTSSITASSSSSSSSTIVPDSTYFGITLPSVVANVAGGRLPRQ